MQILGTQSPALYGSFSEQLKTITLQEADFGIKKLLN